MIYQLTPMRFFTVYIVQSFLIVFYLFITYRLLKNKEGKNRKRIIFVIYYVFCSIGLILNYIYAPLQSELWSSTLYLFTIYIIYVGTSFIAIFSITMYFEIKDNTDTTKIQVVYIVVFSSLYLIMFIIKDGIIINENTNWIPVVNLPFFIFCTILINISLSVFIFYSILTLRIFNKRNQTKILINRWKLYTIGITETMLFASITMLTHLLNIRFIRDVWSIIGGIIMISGIYLTWYGIGKKFL